MIGTTPTHEFELPFDTSTIKTVRVIYCQNNKNILTKTAEGCKLEGNKVTVKLTQEESFMFNHKYEVCIQVRVLLNTDEALKSEEIHIKPTRCLEDEVIV